MLTRRPSISNTTADRPAELTEHTTDIFLVGIAKAAIPPVGAAGRWDLLLMSADDARALYFRHRAMPVMSKFGESFAQLRKDNAALRHEVQALRDRPRGET